MGRVRGGSGVCADADPAERLVRGRRDRAVSRRIRHPGSARQATDQVWRPRTGRNSCGRYDLIADIACHGGVASVRHCLESGGGYVVIGGNGRGYLEAATVGTLLTLTTSKKMGILNWKVNDSDDMSPLADLLSSGKLAPHIDRTYPLDAVPEAMRRLESGDAHGKLVITA